MDNLFEKKGKLSVSIGEGYLSAYEASMLKAGDIVTTGTFTGLLFVEPDAKVTAEFPGVGQVWVRFSA